MTISEQLIGLLSKGIAGNQAVLVEALRKQGIKTTQSSVSRALKKINAVKGLNARGETIYKLPQPERAALLGSTENNLFGKLVLKIQDNGQMIVLHTRPGTAPTVAKVIDDHGFGSIIGTVAGDDTIMIVPADPKQTRQTAEQVSVFLAGVGLYSIG